MRRLHLVSLLVLALLGPFLLPIGIPAARAQSASPATAAQPPSSTAPTGSPSASSRQDLIDINTASADDLQVLKGIGPARAAAIVKGRPYRGKDELHRKDIIPRSVYEDIKDRVVARQ
jgi:competence protein ComEA